MPVRLTDTAIARAIREAPETGRKDVADANCPGLRLRVTPAGAATWVLACRDREGRMRRFALGSYPEKRISEARTEARALHTRVRQDGADPTEDARRQRAIGAAARAGVGTLGALLDLYGDKVGSRQKAWGEARKRINLIFRPLIARPAETLARRDFQMIADAWPAQASAAYAVRSLRPALKWGAAREYLPEDVARLHPPVPVGRRKRVLSRQELGALLPVLRASERPYGPALRFMLFTLARRQEVAMARWRDVDWAASTWTIPQTKNGEPHAVPLSRQAIELLRSRVPAGETMSADALIFATATGQALMNWDRETKTIMQASGTEGWHRHDLRRSGATLLGEMGEMPDIIEAALNHVAVHSQLAATYNRARYRPQVAAALQRLADLLDGIEAGGAEVVALRPAAPA